MRKRINVGLLFVTLLGCCTSVGAAAQNNVLLLVSDNHNWNDCGCYGNPIVETPNLDRLASDGIRFNYAFATTASCGPSRAVMYTGLHAHSNGQYGHPHSYHNFRLRPQVKTVFELLAAGGYRTGLIGKAHIDPPAGAIQFQPNVNGYDVAAMAKAAEEFFRAGDDPFLLVLGYHDPHPTSREEPGWGIRRTFEGVQPVVYNPSEMIVPSYLPDRPEVRAGLAGYYQQISRLDTGIGQVLDALGRCGKDDQTLVIFFSDHGSSEPGAMANHYEPGVRIPFIVRSPVSVKRGSVSDAMIALVDVVPTIFEWTGVAGPKDPLHGRSILPLLDAEHPAGWDEVYLSHVFHEVTMYYPMRTIRTRRHKLIWNIAWRLEYPLPIDTLARATWQQVLRRGDKMIGPRSVEKFLFRDELELYDLERDPEEVVNLAYRPEMMPLRQELLAKLVDYLQQTGDPWLLRHQPPADLRKDSAHEDRH